MGIDNAQAFGFLCHILQAMDINAVLEKVGKIAGVKAVSITQHYFVYLKGQGCER
jgi:hypothetical protein